LEKLKKYGAERRGGGDASGKEANRGRERGLGAGGGGGGPATPPPAGAAPAAPSGRARPPGGGRRGPVEPRHRGGTDGVRAVAAVDGVVDLLAVDRDLLGGHDPQPDLVAANLHHRHRDVVVDDDALVFFPGQYQHRRLSFSKPGGRLGL